MMSLLACQRLSPSGPGAGGAQRPIALRFMAMSISNGVDESGVRTAVAGQVTDALQRLAAARQADRERVAQDMSTAAAGHDARLARLASQPGVDLAP